MFFGYRAGVVLTSLVLATALQATAAPADNPPCYPSDIYSARALRRIRILLQLRLLELRKERLALAAEAVQHRISIDELLRETPEPLGVRKGMRMKHTGCPHAT